jgi:hypothetical protein
MSFVLLTVVVSFLFLSNCGGQQTAEYPTQKPKPMEQQSSGNGELDITFPNEVPQESPENSEGEESQGTSSENLPEESSQFSIESDEPDVSLSELQVPTGSGQTTIKPRWRESKSPRYC